MAVRSIVLRRRTLLKPGWAVMGITLKKKQLIGHAEETRISSFVRPCREPSSIRRILTAMQMTKESVFIRSID